MNRNPGARHLTPLSDVSLESLGTGMSKLARTAAEAAGGSKQQAAAFQAIGVSVKDANGNLLPMQTSADASVMRSKLLKADSSKKAAASSSRSNSAWSRFHQP